MKVNTTDVFLATDMLQMYLVLFTHCISLLWQEQCRALEIIYYFGREQYKI